MFRDITRYVRQCTKCNQYKSLQLRPAGRMHAHYVEPWKQVAIDLVGPLPRSHNGHIWLLTMQDRFTKWLEIRPLRRATASTITREVANTIIYRHGCPNELISDNGTQLKSRELAQLLQAFNIKHRKTPAYAPHCNPVERTNKTIKTMISQYVDKNHRQWDARLPQLQYAYNTARYEATGYTPAFLTYGRELAGPHPDEQRARGTNEAYLKQLHEAHEIVRIQMARNYQRQEKYYNMRRRPWQPKIGELVWKRDHPLSNKAAAFNAKLAPKYIGPMTVRRIISPVIVDLKDHRNKWHRHVHIQDLKPTGETNEDNNTPTNINNEPRQRASNMITNLAHISSRKGDMRKHPHVQTTHSSAMDVELERLSAVLDELKAIQPYVFVEETEASDIRTEAAEGEPPRQPRKRIGTLQKRDERAIKLVDPTRGDPEVRKKTRPAKPIAGRRPTKAGKGKLPPRPPNPYSANPASAFRAVLTKEGPPSPPSTPPPPTATVATISALPIGVRTPPPMITPLPDTPPRRPTVLYGPDLPPDIQVEVSPGVVIDVPHFAAHVSRQYKARAAGGRWHIRFTHRGQLRSTRFIPDRQA